MAAGGSAVRHIDGLCLEFASHLNPLAYVPADCKSLTVDQYFTPFVDGYTEQPAKLRHLAIKYVEHETYIMAPGRDPVEILNNLSHLTQLRSLHVEAPSDSYKPARLHNLPVSLTSLHMDGIWGVGGTTISLPEPDLGWGRESEHLRRLAMLEFHSCCMDVCVGSIARLQNLTSLSYRHSVVGTDVDDILKLTNLVSLDLIGLRSPSPSPWRRLEAWPALCVLKFAGCCMIVNTTVLDISTVQEVHADRLAQGMETANIHLYFRDDHAIMLGLLASLLSPVWSTHIVGLHVVITDTHDTAPHLATIVNQVLEALLCLQSFQLVGESCEQRRCYDHRHGRIVLSDGYSGQLRNLKLQNMYCSTLDLKVATCLTSISLKVIEKKDVSCELILPSSVVRLNFRGNFHTLTTRHAKCLLEGLSCLTQVTLGLTKFTNRRRPELNSSACMPTMPSSLLWLSVESNTLKQLLDRCAQDCLRHCLGLEYLILPLSAYPQGALLTWVQAAQYVRVSDNDPGDILRYLTVLNSAFD